MSADRFSLAGKVALVTGGSQGLGLAMAEALAEAGADVALAARRGERLAAAVERIHALGRRALPLSADVSRLDEAVSLVERTVEKLGRLDVLVTAAGAQLRKPALEVEPEEWEYLVAVNLRAVYFLCQRAARHMLSRERPPGGGARGKIVNVASLTAVAAWPDVSVYGATKGGVVQATKAFAREWAEHGICVNAVGPGTFHTELTDDVYSDPRRRDEIVARIPLGRPGVPSDLAGATVFLASPASDYVTGQVVWVDGGWLASS